jgi:hypothetical protein
MDSLSRNKGMAYFEELLQKLEAEVSYLERKELPWVEAYLQKRKAFMMQIQHLHSQIRNFKIYD